jgi:hypothetical protein
LHRCLQRRGIGRLPGGEGYPICYFHVDIAKVQAAEGGLYFFVAIDRTSKFAFVQLVDKANRVTVSAFPHRRSSGTQFYVAELLLVQGWPHPRLVPACQAASTSIL